MTQPMIMWDIYIMYLIAIATVSLLQRFYTTQYMYMHIHHVSTVELTFNWSMWNDDIVYKQMLLNRAPFQVPNSNFISIPDFLK